MLVLARIILLSLRACRRIFCHCARWSASSSLWKDKHNWKVILYSWQWLPAEKPLKNVSNKILFTTCCMNQTERHYKLWSSRRGHLSLDTRYCEAWSMHSVWWLGLLSPDTSGWRGENRLRVWEEHNWGHRLIHLRLKLKGKTFPEFCRDVYNL